MPGNTVVLLASDEGRRLVTEKCLNAGISIMVFEELVDAKLEQQGKMRERGLYTEFDRIFDAAAAAEESR